MDLPGIQLKLLLPMTPKIPLPTRDSLFYHPPQNESNHGAIRQPQGAGPKRVFYIQPTGGTGSTATDTRSSLEKHFLFLREYSLALPFFTLTVWVFHPTLENPVRRGPPYSRAENRPSGQLFPDSTVYFVPSAKFQNSQKFA